MIGSLRLLVAVLAYSCFLTAAPAASKLQCVGCAAEVSPTNAAGGGESIDVCVGTEFYVKVSIAATDGKCVTQYPYDPENPCLAEGCRFDITLGWKLPAGASADLCNAWGGQSRCLTPPPVATGGDEHFDYGLGLGCNDVQHAISSGGAAPCGYLKATVFAKCTKCVD